MSRAVLLSIQPKWCELIASGKKTIEVRKTKPKLETPFKCYIYCTKGNVDLSYYSQLDGVRNGKVIGEFVCDGIITDRTFGHDPLLKAASCMNDADIAAYCINKEMYGWHISDLVIYDEPRTLGEFFHACNKPRYTDCSVCIDHRAISCTEITRPPQSWCYVEEAQDG